MSDSNSSTNYTLILTREKYSKLLTMLNLFRDHCSDVDIRHGLMRCKSTDARSFIEMDLSSILEDKDLMMSTMKNKIILLKALEVDDNVTLEDQNIYIESNDSNVEFTDQMSKTIFRKPALKYMENRFSEDSEFRNLVKVLEEDLLLQHTFSSYMKKRISTTALALQTESIQFSLDGDTASASIQSRDKQNSMLIADAIVLNRQIQGRTFDIPITTFTLDMVSDITLGAYLPQNGNVCTCKFGMTYFGIPINIYHKVKLV